MNTAGGSEARDVGQRRLALRVEGTAPIGAVLARQLAALIRRSAIAQGPEHAASWIESWPPAGFRPTVHGIGTLFPALGELVDRHDLAL